MNAVIEIIIDGVKKFGGEIIAGILLAVALWLFPGLRKIFRKKDDSGEEVKKQLEQLQDVLNKSLRRIIQKRKYKINLRF